VVGGGGVQGPAGQKCARLTQDVGKQPSRHVSAISIFVVSSIATYLVFHGLTVYCSAPIGLFIVTADDTATTTRPEDYASATNNSLKPCAMPALLKAPEPRFDRSSVGQKMLSFRLSKVGSHRRQVFGDSFARLHCPRD